MHKALCRKDHQEFMFQWKKKEGRGLTRFEYCVDATIQRLKEYTKKSREPTTRQLKNKQENKNEKVYETKLEIKTNVRILQATNKENVVLLTWTLEYTNCFSAEEQDPTHSTSVPDMTLNNLMVRFQWCWPGVAAPDRAPSTGQIELNCVLMLNWIIWNITVFNIEAVLTLNWIFLNITVFPFNRV